MDNRVRLLIVDDSLTIRAMLEEVIGRDEDIDIVGAAAGGEQALAMIERHQPDVVTIDLAMPGMSGMALMERVLAAGTTTPLIVSGQSQRRIESLDRGALGFFDKTRLLVDSVRLTDMIKAAGRSNRPGKAPAQPAAA